MATSISTYQPSLALVFGYLGKIDTKSTIAIHSRLDERFSLALDTYNPETNDSYFDQEMFIRLLTSILWELSCDRVEIETDNSTLYSCEDLSLFPQIMRTMGQAPCEKIFIYEKKILICAMQIEDYTASWGPHPYHDTYNFAFFLNAMKQYRLQEVLEQTCKENHYWIRAIEVGSSEPSTMNLWSHIKNFLTKK